MTHHSNVLLWCALCKLRRVVWTDKVSCWLSRLKRTNEMEWCQSSDLPLCPSQQHAPHLFLRFEVISVEHGIVDLDAQAAGEVDVLTQSGDNSWSRAEQNRVGSGAPCFSINSKFSRPYCSALVHVISGFKSWTALILWWGIQLTMHLRMVLVMIKHRPWLQRLAHPYTVTILASCQALRASLRAISWWPCE